MTLNRVASLKDRKVAEKLTEAAPEKDADRFYKISHPFEVHILE